MGYSELQTKVEAEYNRLFERCRSIREEDLHGMAEYMIRAATEYRDGMWVNYYALLRSSLPSFEGKTALDFGCKIGSVFPLLRVMGAGRILGVEQAKEAVEAVNLVYGGLYDNAEALQSQEGYIPLESESVDYILCEEVISHVTPAYHQTVLSEWARILKPGGVVFVHDGNNLADKERRKKLMAYYEAWELGPDGVETDRNVVGRCMLNRRKDLIRQWHPDIDESTLDLLAQNTSGLYGDRLAKEVAEYLTTGRLAKRPYRWGVCPLDPDNGNPYEMGFYPRQVECDLERYGLKCRFLLVRDHLAPRVEGPAKTLGRLISMARRHLRYYIRPSWEMARAPISVLGVTTD